MEGDKKEIRIPTSSMNIIEYQYQRILMSVLLCCYKLSND